VRLRRRSRYGYRPRLRGHPVQVGLGLFAALVLCAALVFGAAGMWLDPERVDRRSVLLAEPPDVIWRLLVDLDTHPTWRRGVSRIERLPEYTGQAAWLEYDGAAIREVRVAESQPPHRLVLMQRSEEGLPSAWEWDVARVAGGSRLTVTRRVTMTAPLQRGVSGLLRLSRREVDRSLTDLAERLALTARLRTTALNR
jgi:uncharacterized protein YndB with AHSA1/START domain